MLAKVFRIRGSNFKMIPNPTKDVWNRPFSPIELMAEFHRNLESLIAEYSSSSQLKDIKDAWQEIQPIWLQNSKPDDGPDDKKPADAPDIGPNNAHNKKPEVEVEDELDDKSDDESDDKPGGRADIDIDLREAIHKCVDAATRFLHRHSTPRSTVISVMGTHLTIVLEELGHLGSYLSSPACNKESNFIEYYFTSISRQVSGYVSSGNPELAPLMELSDERKWERLEIWVTLLFRMCCWFLLHDFDKSDVLILPSRLKGSRLPVYIS
jgi:hypothetical protein